MKTKFLMIFVIIGSSALFLIPIFYEMLSKENPSDDRESLKEVVWANTACSIHWRTNLYEMWDNSTYEFKNDPIFQECLQWLEFEKYANTSYHTKLDQIKVILEYCIDSKDLVDAKNLSYSNETHYIDTVNCEWQELEMIENKNLLRN